MKREAAGGAFGVRFFRMNIALADAAAGEQGLGLRFGCGFFEWFEILREREFDRPAAAFASAGFAARSDGTHSRAPHVQLKTMPV
jgi:hypothetical protein